MAIRVLIINRQLAFSVALKQALERTGSFDVHPFTTSDAALEYLQSAPQDVALIDFTSVSPSGTTVVEALRRIQPALPVVVSPEQPDDLMRQWNLQASIDPPFNARDIMPLLTAAAGGEEAADLRRLPTRPVSLPPTAPSPPPPSTPAASERKLRPGEIDETTLRPYMYSSDVFKKRTSEELVGFDQPSAPSASRPGELRTDDLAGPSTDVFKRQGSARLRPGEADPSQPQGSDVANAPPSGTENRSYRPGELRTQDLPDPSTNVFHEPTSEALGGALPPLERPDRRRPPTEPFVPEPPREAERPSVRPGEFSEQDLLNLAVNRGAAAGETAASAPPPPSPRPGEIDLTAAGDYRISTDVFKDQEDQELSLSPEDAAAMWEQLTRDEGPVQSFSERFVDPVPPEVQSDEDAFNFDFDDPQDTPSGVSFPGTEVFVASAEDAVLPTDSLHAEPVLMPKSITDLLIAKAQDVVLPPDDPQYLSDDPVSKTDVLLAAAEELDMPLLSDPAEGLPSQEDYPIWDFPDEEQAPKVGTDVLNNSRRTTEGFPIIRQSEEVEPVEAERLDEQYEVEALSGISDDGGGAFDMSFGDGSRRSITDEVNAAYQMPYDENLHTNPLQADDEEIVYEKVSDEFEPPISAEQLITSYLNSEVEYYGQETPDEFPAVMADEDAGVRRLEEIAAEIRRTRETNPFTETQNNIDLRADEVFQKLAAEEPPLPTTAEDSGTVGDLYNVVSDPEFQGVLRLLRADDPPPAPSIAPPAVSPGEPSSISQSEIADIFASYGKPTPAFTEFDFGEPNDESSAAQVILEAALTEQTPADEFSLPSLIASIERQLEQGKSAIKPLPSWVNEKQFRDDLYVREPDFLPEVIAEVDALPQLDEQEEDPYDATTFAGSAQTAVGDMETDWMPAVQPRPSALQDANLLPEPPIAEDDTAGGTKPLEMPALPRLEDDEPEYNTEFERLAAFDFPPEDDSQYTPPMGVEAIQDPYIAQIALSLTQVSLEDIAGIVLTRENEIMANAGRMSRDEIMEIDAGLGGMWDNEGDQFNIRFITLSNSAKDYMVYSKRTVSDLTLSLVFPGATPLRAIRAQAKRLLEALVSVPETTTESAESELVPVVDSDVRGLYTYVWLLREAQGRLSDMIARAIESNMRTQLEARAWQIVNLRVQDEFVYLVADVPGETPPYEVVRDLKRRAHEIARKQNPALAKADLWADGYLVVAPGRELGEDEILSFIQFERMTQ